MSSMSFRRTTKATRTRSRKWPGNWRMTSPAVIGPVNSQQIHLAVPHPRKQKPAASVYPHRQGPGHQNGANGPQDARHHQMRFAANGEQTCPAIGDYKAEHGEWVPQMRSANWYRRDSGDHAKETRIASQRAGSKPDTESGREERAIVERPQAAAPSRPPRQARGCRPTFNTVQYR